MRVWVSVVLCWVEGGERGEVFTVCVSQVIHSGIIIAERVIAIAVENGAFWLTGTFDIVVFIA